MTDNKLNGKKDECTVKGVGVAWRSFGHDTFRTRDRDIVTIMTPDTLFLLWGLTKLLQTTTSFGASLPTKNTFCVEKTKLDLFFSKFLSF